MKKHLCCLMGVIMFSWFFLFQGGGNSVTAQVVGPFVNRENCEKIAAWVKAGGWWYVRVSECWSDGKFEE